MTTKHVIKCDHEDEWNVCVLFLTDGGMTLKLDEFESTKLTLSQGEAIQLLRLMMPQYPLDSLAEL